MPPFIPMRPTSSLCRRGGGAYYYLYDEACYLVRASLARLPSGHHVGWNFEAIAAYERDKRDSGVWSGINDQCIGWLNDVPFERRDRNRDVKIP